MLQRVMIAGGYGVVGSAIARNLRAANRDVEIVLAGRNPERGAALARELGGASTAHLDIADPAAIDLGGCDLVISALYDGANALVSAAIAQGVAHIGITTKADDVAPVAALALASPPKRPVVLLGYCCAGAVTLLALNAARQFSKIDSIAIAALFDPRDPVGPMTAADPEALISRALLRQGGVWSWVDGMQHPRTVRLTDEVELPAFPTALLDAPGLAAVTGAQNVRLDLTQGDSLGSLSGASASSDAYIDIEGVLASGAPGKRRVVVSDPNGLASFTALGVLVAAERVLGLDGDAPAAGGLYLPEALLAADQAAQRLQQRGVRVIAP